MKPNIIQTRVDARLLHGQASMWIKSNGCNLVILADDESSVNEMQKDLMDTTVPDGVGSRYFTIQKTIDIIGKAAASQKIFIVVRDIKGLKQLIDGGVPIVDVNIGNVHQDVNTTKYTSHINLNKEEEEMLLTLSEQGVEFQTKIMPTIEKGEIDIINQIKKNRK